MKKFESACLAALALTDWKLRHCRDAEGVIHPDKCGEFSHDDLMEIVKPLIEAAGDGFRFSKASFHDAHQGIVS